MNTSSQAVGLLNKYEEQARAGMVGETLAALAKRARGDLAESTAFGIALLESSGVDLAKASARMLSPEVSAMTETSAERVAGALYSCMEHETALKFNQNLSTLEAIASESVGHLCVWAFEDGSAWVAFTRHEREVAYDALLASGFEEREELGEELWRMWDTTDALLPTQVGKKFLHAKKTRTPLVALSPMEARAFAKGLARAWCKEAGKWGKGMSVKLMTNGQELTPAEFEKAMLKSLERGKDELVREGLRRVEEIRKERESRMKIHWRDALCAFLTKPSELPVQDGGLAAFLMSKPGLFGQHPLTVWNKMFAEIVAYLGPLSENDHVELSVIEGYASMLGGNVASQMAHYLYRYHRAGGAKTTAKRVLEQTRERMVAESGRQGLAAAVKLRDTPMSIELRESSKAASSVEFSTQYGAALALYAALWAREAGFADIATQARAVVRTMRGAGDISMECFGWFARLIFEFSAGAVSKEEVARALQKEMEDAAKAADDEKKLGGKITIENEWSGNWGVELAMRKVREYLDMGLDRTRSIAQQALHSQG